MIKVFLITSVALIGLNSISSFTTYAARSIESRSSMTSENIQEKITDYEIIRTMLHSFIEKQGYDKKTEINIWWKEQDFKPDGNVIVTFDSVPENNICFYNEAVRSCINFMEDNNIDSSLVEFNFLHEPTVISPEKVEKLSIARKLLTDFLKENNLPAYIQDEPFYLYNKSVISIYYIWYNEEKVIPVVKEFMLENDIDLDLVAYVVADTDYTVLGDTNCNGSVDISDAILAKAWLLNNEKYIISEQGIKNADVIGNNGINTQDALAIQQYAVGLIDTF